MLKVAGAAARNRGGLRVVKNTHANESALPEGPINGRWSLIQNKCTGCELLRNESAAPTMTFSPDITWNPVP